MKLSTHLADPLSIVARPLVAFLAVALIIAAACSESSLPTETEAGLQPHLASVVLAGCPNPFTLTETLDADGQAADRNADGVACSLTDNGIIVSWTDNNVPLSQIGECPNGFTFDYAKNMVPMNITDVDRNGDGFACFRTTGNGSTIVIDNNTSAPKMM
jgi:hypothetical protein